LTADAMGSSDGAGRRVGILKFFSGIMRMDAENSVARTEHVAEASSNCESAPHIEKHFIYFGDCHSRAAKA